MGPMKRVLMIALVIAACSAAAAMPVPTTVNVEVWMQAGDSVKFVVSWSASSRPTARYAPIATYDVRLRRSAAVIASSSVAGAVLRDTLAMVYPPLNATVDSLVAEVRARTVTDSTAWVPSRMFSFKNTPLPPLPVDSVKVDTIPYAVALYVRPSYVAMAPGARVQFCAILVFSDSSSGYRISNPDGTGHLSPNGAAYCQMVYDLWKQEWRA